MSEQYKRPYFRTKQRLVSMMLASSIVILAYLGPCITAGANIELANMWLHHEMAPWELNRHFGVETSNQVSPDMYQVIKIQTHDSSKSKRQGGNEGQTAISFVAFGQHRRIQLIKNRNLLSKDAKAYLIDGSQKLPLELPSNTDCHFLSDADSLLSAAMSNCQGQNYVGHVIDEGSIFEINPLHQRFNDLLMNEDEQELTWHIITRRPIHQLPDFGAELPTNASSSRTEELKKSDGSKIQFAAGSHSNNVVKRASGDLTIETAVFLDPAAYRAYLRYYRGDPDQVTNMLLAFMNGVQAIYHFKSLGRRIDFTIVHLELMSSSPFNDGRGEREALLTNFCKYQSSQNVHDDTNPNHWDIALDLSGLDFYDGNTGSTVTMGLATVTGVCDKLYNCVIGEIGVSNTAGKPYPSAGFTSVFVMAHEIGHNLGMHHDGSAGCPSNGYVMSASRGTKGEVEWSSCSARVVGSLNMACLTDNNGPANAAWNHMKKYQNMPGLKWSSDEQCQFLLRDLEAKTDHTDEDLPDICQRLYCVSPSKAGYFAAGPALEGTRCSKSAHKVCHEGQCVAKPEVPVPSQSDVPKWSQWSDFGPCENNCISGSAGAQSRTRYCIYPSQAPAGSGCPGPAIQTRTCSAPAPCKAYVTVEGFAAGACQSYMDKSTRLALALNPNGKQGKYDPSRPDIACTVYCEQKRSVEWLSPQMYFTESDDIDLYFPDGTPCNQQNSKQNYYCLKHQCVSGDASRTPRSDQQPPVEIFQNALPEEPEAKQTVLDFFSADDNGQPLDAPPPSDKHEENSDEFEQDDEINISKRGRHHNDREFEYEYEQDELERSDFSIE